MRVHGGSKIYERDYAAAVGDTFYAHEGIRGACIAENAHHVIPFHPIDFGFPLRVFVPKTCIPKMCVQAFHRKSVTRVQARIVRHMQLLFYVLLGYILRCDPRFCHYHVYVAPCFVEPHQ